MSTVIEFLKNNMDPDEYLEITGLDIDTLIDCTWDSLEPEVQEKLTKLFEEEIEEFYDEQS